MEPLIKPYFETKNGKLYHGDCLEIMPQLDPVDLTVTSPPYDNLRNYEGYKFDFEGIAKELYRVTKQGGVVVWVVGDATINGSETGTSFRQALYFKDACGFNLHDTMIYEKANISFPDANRYYQSFEYMFIISKGCPKTWNPITKKNPQAGKPIYPLKRGKDGVLVKDRGYLNNKKAPELSVLRNIFKYNNGKKNELDHPAIFPEQLARDHIISWSNEGDTVLDCFAGSGTTLKMAEIYNRRWIGIEISEKYCEIAAKRIEHENQQLKLFA